GLQPGRHPRARRRDRARPRRRGGSGGASLRDAAASEARGRGDDEGVLLRVQPALRHRGAGRRGAQGEAPVPPTSLDDFYRQTILDHYQNPRTWGMLEDPDITAQDANPLCGDEIRIDLKIKDDRVEAVRFSGKGCSISRAAASMLTEAVEGKTLDE